MTIEKQIAKKVHEIAKNIIKAVNKTKFPIKEMQKDYFIEMKEFIENCAEGEYGTLELIQETAIELREKIKSEVK